MMAIQGPGAEPKVGRGWLKPTGFCCQPAAAQLETAWSRVPGGAAGRPGAQDCNARNGKPSSSSRGSAPERWASDRPGRRVRTLLFAAAVLTEPRCTSLFAAQQTSAAALRGVPRGARGRGSTLPRASDRMLSSAAARALRVADAAALSRGQRQMSRLAALKEQLEADGPDLAAFAGLQPRVVPSKASARERKPAWLRTSAPTGAARAKFDQLHSTVKDLNLATVCEEAQCPNIGECWGGGEGVATATIMVMGDTCTRGCSFCAVKTSNRPAPLDPAEPDSVAAAVASWGLDYVVLTSVDRDDLPDQGSEHLASTVKALKAKSPDLLVEVLAPDFQGRADLIRTVTNSGLDVHAHNLETVERLQGRVRDRRAGYKQSLAVLEAAKAANPNVLTKTSLMLGVGERPEEIIQTLRDCREAGVDVVTLGQYLRPSKRHLPVAEYVHPDKFAEWQAEGEAMGFVYVASGPLVRSSYKAGEFFIRGLLKARQAARISDESTAAEKAIRLAGIHGITVDQA